MGKRRTTPIRSIIEFILFIAVPLLIVVGIFLANHANTGFELEKNGDRLDQFFGEDNWQVVHHTVVERITNRCCYTHLLLFLNPIAKIVVSQDSHNTPLQ